MPAHDLRTDLRLRLISALDGTALTENEEVAGVLADTAMRSVGRYAERWTFDDAGRGNSSAEFVSLVAEVDRIIRDGAHELIAGRSTTVSGIIVAVLADKYGMAPVGTRTPDSED